MKLIRLTDDRYFLDAGPDIRPAQLETIKAYWKDWWEKNPGEIPTIFIVGGIEMPVVYEDRRDADLERRVAALEQHVHVVGHIDGHPINSGPAK